MRFEAREVQRRTPISQKGEPLQIPKLRKITAAPAILQIGSEIQAQGLISTRIIPSLPHCISMLLLNSAAAARLKHVPQKENKMTIQIKAQSRQASRTIFVNELTNGVLDPDVPMLGPVADGGIIVANAAPGCWGPMITPEIHGGHEVTRPVAVEGAEVGDAVAIRIRSLVVTSAATASGNDNVMDARFNGDPFCAAVCPGCGTEWPRTCVEGIGQTAIRCEKCGADATPFTFANGYTIAFDDGRQIGLTVGKARAEAMAQDAERLMALPDASIQHPILTFAPADLVGVATRLRPFLGQLGTTPSQAMPDSHNAGDLAHS